MSTAAAAAELQLLRERVQQLERELAIQGSTRSRAASHEIEQLRLLAESIPQLVWSCRPNGECEYLSRLWEEYTGIAAAKQLGLHWLDVVIHPDDRERTLEAWMPAVADQAGLPDSAPRWII